MTPPLRNFPQLRFDESFGKEVVEVRGQAGQWLNRADLMESLFQDRDLFHEQEISDLTDLDPVKGYSEFQTQQLALNAALQSYAQVQKKSLFQYMA